MKKEKKPLGRGFLTVDYDDGKQSTYRGLKVEFRDVGKTMLFNTGNALIDWYDYHKFIYGGEAHKQGVSSIGHSSNVDHWFMDGNKYVEKYLKVDKETQQISFYTKDELLLTPFHKLDGIIKCTITNQFKSFDGLKKYYKKHKK